jgi:hypothetical protein
MRQVQATVRGVALVAVVALTTRPTLVTRELRQAVSEAKAEMVAATGGLVLFAQAAAAAAVVSITALNLGPMGNTHKAVHRAAMVGEV